MIMRTVRLDTVVDDAIEEARGDWERLAVGNRKSKAAIMSKEVNWVWTEPYLIASGVPEAIELGPEFDLGARLRLTLSVRLIPKIELKCHPTPRLESSSPSASSPASFAGDLRQKKR